MCDSGTNDRKIFAYRVTRPGYIGTSCTYRDMNTLFDAELSDAGVGSRIEIEVLQMTEHEFENLSEFEGW